MKINFKEVLIVFMSIFVLSNFGLVSAFSIATLYGDNYPLKMYPGESKETFFLIRNVVEGDSDISVMSEISKGAEIAKFIQGPRTYEVPFGTEIEVPVKIEIPKDAKAGKEYRVGAIFKPIYKEEELGNIQFIVNIGKSFPIIIIEGTEEQNREISRITIEDEGGIVETLAPFVKGGNGILLLLILILIIGIIIITMLIVFFVINMRKKALIQSQITSQF